MSPPRVELEIRKLVLHGFPPLDRHSVAEAVQRELAARLGARPPGTLRSADRLDAGRFEAPPAPNESALGAGIAQRLGKALG